VRQVSVQQFRRLAGAELAQRTDQVLDHEEWGVALYKTDTMKFVISFGNRFADLAYRHPPSNYGDAILECYLMPEPPEQEMMSPVFKALRDPNRLPQIAAPPRQPPRTVYPDYRT
jgi:hypothetical protein